MKRLFLVTVLVAFSGVAFAKCPPGTKYDCYQAYNGKVICGCR